VTVYLQRQASRLRDRRGVETHLPTPGQ